MRFWNAILAALAALCLVATGARAAGFDEGNRTFNNLSANNLGNYATPQEYGSAIGSGCIENGSFDCTNAIISALATHKNVYLRAGTYSITAPLTLSSGQMLYGDGRGLTTISVNSNFVPDTANCSQTASPQTCGIVYLTGSEQLSPQVRDLSFVFAQPGTPAASSSLSSVLISNGSGAAGSIISGNYSGSAPAVGQRIQGTGTTLGSYIQPMTVLESVSASGGTFTGTVTIPQYVYSATTASTYADVTSVLSSITFPTTTTINATIVSGTPVNGNALNGQALANGTTTGFVGVPNLSGVSISAGALTATLSVAQTGTPPTYASTAIGRGNFANVSTGCSTANLAPTGGGTGCIYPWAIYAKSSNRFRIERVSVYAAWDGIGTNPSGPGGGEFIDNVEMGAYDIGLDINYGKDFCHVSHWHSWDFNIANVLFYNVYWDGNTDAFVLNECDGINIQDFDTEIGNVIVQNAATAALFSNLGLDTGSQLRITGCQWCEVSNVYADGVPVNGQANIEVSAGIANGIENLHCNTVNSTCVDVNTAGTVLEVESSTFLLDPAGGSIGLTVSPITATLAGQLTVQNSEFKIGGLGSGGAFNVPIVAATGTGGTAAFLRFTGNRFNNLTGAAAAVSITTDSSYDQVSNNQFSNWTFAAPGNAGFYANNSIPSASASIGLGTPSPTTNTSSCVMFGYGATATITPVTGSGRVSISIAGSTFNNTASDGLTIRMYYGTGTAPSYGASAAGTAIGTLVQVNNPTGSAGLRAPFTTQAILTGLTPGTAYWFDECVEAVGGGSAYLTAPAFTAQEF